MSNGLIAQALDAVQRGLKLVIPRLDVELYDGIFDEEALDRVLTRTGRVHLTFLEADPAMALVGGQTVLNASFGAYVATSGRDRGMAGINAMEGVAAGLTMMARTEGAEMPPYTLQPVLGPIQNLYSKATGERAVAIYGMSFAIPIIIGQAVFDNDTTVYDPAGFTFEVEEAGVTTVLDPNDTEKLEPAP